MYFVTGFYKDKKESGYYIYSSNAKKAVKLSNKYIVNNKDVVKDLVGVELGAYKSLKNQILTNTEQDNTTTIYNPSILENNRITNNTKTVVYIDFLEGLVGVVDYSGENLEWIKLGEFIANALNNNYNNISYFIDTNKLNLSYYHIIGEEKQHDILLRISEDDKNNKLEKEIATNEKIIDINDITNVNGYDINITPEQNLISFKDSKDNNVKIAFNEIEYFESILSIMKDNDVITVPLEIFNQLKFKIRATLDSTINLEKRILLGIIDLENYQSKILAIVNLEQGSNFVRVQIVMSTQPSKDKNYSVEYIKDEYRKWKQSMKFLAV